MKNDIETALSNLASELYRVGYTHQSNLYQLLNNISFGNILDFSGKISYTLSLATMLEKIDVVKEVEIEIQELYNFYYIDLKEKTGYLRIYDDFEEMVYSCNASILSLTSSMSHYDQLDVIRSHLVGKRIIRKFDMLVL